MNSDLSNLTEPQKTQVMMQWQKQQHLTHERDIELTAMGDKLKDFVIYHQVWNPAITSARYHASYLLMNNERLYSGKRVLDMGCGTGLMGIIMGLNGANSVTFSDISETAVANAKENVERFGLKGKSYFSTGDLFQNLNLPDDMFDFIVFNHPFFSATPSEKGEKDLIAQSMLADRRLIERFLKNAKERIGDNSRIMMPFFSLAENDSNSNSPLILGEKLGYNVEPTFSLESNFGLQKGTHTIYELTLRGKQ